MLPILKKKFRTWFYILPKGPRKSTEILKTLVKKFDQRFQMKSTEQKKRILNQEEQVYLTDFLNGRNFRVYVRKSGVVTQYETKRYLLLSLHESLNIINTRQDDNLESHFGETLFLTFMTYKAA